MNNIAQIEFFHVGGREVKSIDDLFDQIADRYSDMLSDVAEGNTDRYNIKTVVRIYDETNVLTEHVHEIARLTEIRKAICEECSHVGAIRARWLSFKERRVRKKAGKVSSALFKQVMIQIRIAITGSREIGIERFDNTFRSMQPNEAHELIEASRKASGVWIFIFKPNALLADKNEPITHAFLDEY
jgi:hypothetical protein